MSAAKRREHRLATEVSQLHRELERTKWQSVAFTNETAIARRAAASEAKEEQRLQKSWKVSRQQLHMADNETSTLRKKVEEKKHRVGPLRSWMNVLPRQWAVALVVGAFGVLGVMGPLVFCNFYRAFIGAIAGGLLASSSASVITRSGSDQKIWDSLQAHLFAGTGSAFGYHLWLFIFLLGILRWFFDFNCAFFVVTDEVHTDNRGNVVQIRGGAQKARSG